MSEEAIDFHTVCRPRVPWVENLNMYTIYLAHHNKVTRDFQILLFSDMRNPGCVAGEYLRELLLVDVNRFTSPLGSLAG